MIISSRVGAVFKTGLNQTTPKKVGFETIDPYYIIYILNQLDELYKMAP